MMQEEDPEKQRKWEASTLHHKSTHILACRALSAVMKYVQVMSRLCIETSLNLFLHAIEGDASIRLQSKHRLS